jgi:hypothetical protein
VTRFDAPASLVGKPSDSAEVRDLLRLGSATDPKLKKGDVRAWVELNSLGLALVFVDEAFFTKRTDLAIGEGALLLSSVTFHTGSDPAYSPYAGALPFGVRFDQSQGELNAQLGPPERSNPRLRLDRWHINGVWYFAKYAPAADRLLTFSMQMPDPQ